MRPTPTLLHVDLDAFFASVEGQDKPSVRGRPVIVGGTGARAVVSTCNYLARLNGIHSAMPIAQARHLAPRNAVFLGVRFAAYRQYSSAVMSILRAFSPAVEQMGLDEAYLDLRVVAGLPDSEDSIRDLAHQLRTTVKEATGLSLSVGAAGDRTTAKMASAAAKPDGVRIVPVAETASFLSTFPLRALPGVGPATAGRLTEVGLLTVGDIARRADLVRRLLPGKTGELLVLRANGEDPSGITPERDLKSCSRESTFEEDARSEDDVRRVMRQQIQDLARELRERRLGVRGLSVRVTTASGRTLSRSRPFPAPTRRVTDLTMAADAALGLLLDSVDPRSGVRRVGVSFTGLADSYQPSLFEEGPAELVEQTSAGSTEDLEWVPAPETYSWFTGEDLIHADYGRGWVCGVRQQSIDVRFETRRGPGPIAAATVMRGSPDIMPAEPDPLSVRVLDESLSDVHRRSGSVNESHHEGERQSGI